MAKPKKLHPLAGRALRWLDALRRRFPALGRHRRLWEENRRYNLERDIVRGEINDQYGGETTGVHEFALGRSRMRDTGCEAIALYNALRLTEQEASLARVAHGIESGGGLITLPFVPCGKMGTNPFSLGRTAPEGLRLQRLETIEEMDAPGVYIFSYWNGKELRRGLHTVAVTADRNGYIVRNQRENGFTTHYHDFAHFSDTFSDRFLLGWRAERDNISE